MECAGEPKKNNRVWIKIQRSRTKIAHRRQARPTRRESIQLHRGAVQVVQLH